MTDSTSQFSMKSSAHKRLTGTIKSGSVSFTIRASNRITDSTLCGEAGSDRDKHCQLLKLTILSVLPGLILVTRNAITLADTVKQLNANQQIQDNIQFSMDIGHIIHECQKERGTLTLYVSSHGDPFLKSRVNSQYRLTDNVILSLSHWIRSDLPEYFVSRSAFHSVMRNFTEHLDPHNSSIGQVIEFYTDNNAVFIHMIGQSLNSDVPVPYWSELVAYQMLIISKEQAGIERALGSTYYSRGHFPQADLLWYKEKLTLGQEYLQQCMKFSSIAKAAIYASYINTRLSVELNYMRDIILVNNKTEPSVYFGTLWFDNMTEYINILMRRQDDLASFIVQRAKTEISEKRAAVISGSVELTIAICIVPVVTFLVWRILKKIQEFATELTIKTEELEQERMRTEELLHQLLPRAVANKLINGDHAVPEAFHAATIMFSDVVGFTSIASDSSPMEVVDMLNQLYMVTDARLEHYDVYKVETIGDGYMVSSGIPSRNGERHVVEIARLTLDLLQNVTSMEIPHMKEEKLAIRLGFNTGPCVAGVVGIKMPRYCIFGDTVNTASRMESTSLPLKIQLTESSAAFLMKYEGFTLSERGVVNIKGKGPMRTFWLESYDEEAHLKNKLIDLTESTEELLETYQA